MKKGRSRTGPLPSSAPMILMWRTLLMVWASTTTSSSQKMRLAPRRCLPEKTEPESATTSAVRWIARWKRAVILRRNNDKKEEVDEKSEW